MYMGYIGKINSPTFFCSLPSLSLSLYLYSPLFPFFLGWLRVCRERMERSGEEGERVEELPHIPPYTSYTPKYIRISPYNFIYLKSIQY